MNGSRHVTWKWAGLERSIPSTLLVEGKQEKTMGFSLSAQCTSTAYFSTVYHYPLKLLWNYYFDSCFEWMIDPILMDTRPQSYFQGYDCSLLRPCHPVITLL